MMWARVRGQTENKLLGMPFKQVYIFRPGVIQPLDKIQSRTPLYRMGYSIMKPILPLLRYAFPKSISSTKLLGQAMLKVTRNGYDKPILRTKDFYLLSLTNRKDAK